MTTKHDFLAVSTMKVFVDKTLLLKHILQCQPFKLITTPKRFGKSTNLDMIKAFLSISVNSEGIKQSKNYTDAHEIFKKLHIHQKEKDFFYENFGMVPVIQIDFKTTKPIKKCIDAFRIIKRKIHESYKQHFYLGNSTHLNSEEKRLCRTWSGINYKRLTEEDVSDGLSHLAKCLHKHFDSEKVFVIVDDYDSLISSVPFPIKQKELTDIVLLITNQLSQIIKSGSVRGAVICGVSILPSLFLSTSDSRILTKYRFLEEHALVDFYGFREEEVEKLFKNNIFNVDPLQVEKAHMMYGGYTSQCGKSIWSIYSVMKFLQAGEPGAYLPPSRYVERLMNAYRIPLIEKTITLCSKGNLWKLTFKEILQQLTFFIFGKCIH